MSNAMRVVKVDICGASDNHNTTQLHSAEEMASGTRAITPHLGPTANASAKSKLSDVSRPTANNS